METFPNLVFVFSVLPVVVFFNAFLKNKAQNVAVLVFSLMFLMWVCKARVVGLLLLVSVATNLSARLVCKASSKKIRLCAFLSVIILIFALIGFSFCFVFSNVFSNRFFDFERILFLLVLMANLSYLIDVYEKYCNLQNSFVNFLTYVFMFPKLFLGPVVPYYKLNKQLDVRKVSLNSLSEGIELFIVGFAKKTVFANEFYEIYGFVEAQTFSNLPVLTAWMGAFAAFLSFVFNFSGYSDMAVGLGKMLGFKLPSSVEKMFFLSDVEGFLNKFNCLVLSYFRNYILPWQGKKQSLCGFLKTGLVGFSMAVFFGGRAECFVVAIYFMAAIGLQRFLFKAFSENFNKVLTLVLLIIGMVLFQNCGVKNNLKYVCAMFGLNGVLIDFSFIFFVRLIKFLIIGLILIVAVMIRKFFKKIQFLKFACCLKYFSLICLFLFSMLLEVSQI